VKIVIVLTAVILAVALGGRTSTASAQTRPTAKQRYYHATGIVKWIGNHARFTQYSPQIGKKHHWQEAVRFWNGIANEAWAEMHPAPVVSVGGWQSTVNCENSGRWYDTPGYFMYGLQFDPHTWATAAAHTGHSGSSVTDQIINATWVAKTAQAQGSPDPWPNCPDPYFG
jgi:hypothetical protein